MTFSAVIIDTRPVDAVIEQHAQFIPNDWDIRWINNEDTTTAAGYNRLLTSKRFWRSMTDVVLIFQHDSRLLRPGLMDFVEWEYCGAPWKFQKHGGNGGLSLRHKSTMMKVIDNFTWDGSQGNEDVWFCNKMLEMGSNLAPREVCSKFSCESIFQLGTLGYHAIKSYLTEYECQQILTQYDKSNLRNLQDNITV